MANPKNQFIRDLKDKESVQSSFLVKVANTGVDKNQKPFMALVLVDKTGEVDARVWEDVARYSGQVVADSFVFVEGRCQLYQGRKQIIVSKIQILREDEIEIKDYMIDLQVDTNALYSKLLEYVASMQDPHYKALAESILKDDADVVDRIKRAPAAKSIHHAYRGGLLEHVVSITGILDDLSKHYGPQVNRDLLFLGGFLHDIGKIWELQYERVTEYTDEGRLIGHLVMGVELIERKIQELNAQAGRLPSQFPTDKKLLAKHMVLAHHGKLEYGSPKEPHVLEALIVHYIDDLDSKINAIKMFIQADASPGHWTGLNRMYERYFYKPEWAVKDVSK